MPPTGCLYRAAQVRELDRLVIQERGIPGYVLMCRAGKAALTALRERWPEADQRQAEERRTAKGKSLFPFAPEQRLEPILPSGRLEVRK